MKSMKKESKQMTWEQLQEMEQKRKEHKKFRMNRMQRHNVWSSVE